MIPNNHPLDIDADGGYCGSLSTNAKLNDPTPQDRR